MPLSETDSERVRHWIERATKRLDGASVAASRERIEDGELDNHFDGIVTAIRRPGLDTCYRPVS